MERFKNSVRLWKRVVVPTAVALIITACAQAQPPGAAPTTAAGPAVGPPAAAPKEVPLNFVVWSYSIETIQDNIKNFEAQNPGVKVNLSDFSWNDYHDVMATRFTGGTKTELAYSSDHWLREWIAAGWAVPLDEHFPEVKEMVNEFAPYSVQGMTADGHIYGLPYYSDMVVFMYNAELAKKAGITKAPETWEELTEQAKKIKEAGVSDFPVYIPLKKDDPWTVEVFYSMVYSRGGKMFDENNNPVFNQPGSEAEKTLQWLHDAIFTDKIMDQSALEVSEPDVVKTMGAGQQLYTVLAKYNLAELNLGQHDQAGNFKLALMPGQEHSTVGFVRFYAMTKDAVAAGADALNAAWKFLQYFGGKTDGEFKVVKRWALDKGLGFAQLPLYDDPEVAAAINKWGDVNLEREQAKLARVKEGLTPWWGRWDIYARTQIHDAVLGTITPQQALKNMADKWDELKQ
jgi:multiple sugar transport system substrate-binding protein